MSEDIRDNLRQYRQIMALAKTMLERDIITKEQYSKIDNIMTKKYNIHSSTIYRENA